MASLSFISSSHLTLRTPSLTLRKTSHSPPSVSFSFKAHSLSQDDLKKLAAEKAVESIKPGMVLGLGTRSTAAFVVDQIGKLLSSGELHDIIGIPTSMKRTNLISDVKEATHEDDDLCNVSEKQPNQTSQFQEWMEVNSNNKEKTNSIHENNSGKKELFYLNLLLNNIKVLASYEDIRTVNGILYPTFEDAYNALFI